MPFTLYEVCLKPTVSVAARAGIMATSFFQNTLPRHHRILVAAYGTLPPGLFGTGFQYLIGINSNECVFCKKPLPHQFGMSNVKCVIAGQSFAISAVGAVQHRRDAIFQIETVTQSTMELCAAFRARATTITDRVFTARRVLSLPKS